MPLIIHLYDAMVLRIVDKFIVLVACVEVLIFLRILHWVSKEICIIKILAEGSPRRNSKKNQNTKSILSSLRLFLTSLKAKVQL